MSSPTASTEKSILGLKERLRAKIKRCGPMSFYDWMKAALYDEREGYYCHADRIRQGRRGDYRTAPETSPLFAGTFAGYFSKLFADLKQPASFTILEAGAGGGEFAHGVLSSLKADAPEVFTVSNYVIDEVSASARDRVAQRLSEFSDRVSFQRFSEIETSVEAGIIFSNEVIDALPVNRVVMRNEKLRQFYVGLNDLNFVWVEDELEKNVAEYCARVGLTLSEGQIAEINLDAEKFVAHCGRLIRSGFVVTVDYGAERRNVLTSPDRHGGTLRAFRRHQMIDDILAAPGEQDLTTTIDWTQIEDAGNRVGLRVLRLERLDNFLLSEGLLDRLAEVTCRVSDSAEAARLSASSRELILPTGMAAAFQVMVQEKVCD